MVAWRGDPDGVDGEIKGFPRAASYVLIASSKQTHMKKNVLLLPALVTLITPLLPVALRAADNNKVWTDPKKAAEEDPDFRIQGEYVAQGTCCSLSGRPSGCRLG